MLANLNSPQSFCQRDDDAEIFLCYSAVFKIQVLGLQCEAITKQLLLGIAT